MFNPIKRTVEGAVRGAFRDATKDFNTLEALQNKIHCLEEEKIRLQDEVAAKKAELTEIEHLVKLKEARNDLNLEKEKVKLEREFQKKELALRTDGFNEMLKHIKDQSTDLKQVFEKIMEKLPDVNMRIKG